jgi:hypothetical protein
MVTTPNEIQQRIEEADQARLRVRVDAATKIADLIQQRARARIHVTELEATAAAQIEAAGAVMTVDELAKFTGIPLGELRVNGNGKAPRKVRVARTPKARGAAAAQQVAPAVDVVAEG